LTIDYAVILVDRMVNSMMASRVDRMQAMTALARSYVAIVLGAIVALAVLSATAPAQATRDAWVHAVIVAVLAVLLPLWLRVVMVGIAVVMPPLSGDQRSARQALT
jgi:fatty acid desaturase